MSSPFLDRPESDWIASNSLAFAIFDGFPVSPGHALIIARRPVATWFEASADEQRALMELVEVVKTRLDETFRPDGYNVGINVGEAAGQTVFHLHVHLIPRYRGDMEDPRGGVRHVIPWRGNYKRTPQVTRLATGAHDPFESHLAPLFESAREIAIVAAFVQDSGLLRLQRHLLGARDRGARVRLLAGDYLCRTSPGALEMLLGWSSAGFEARVHETAPGSSFHPKSWRFETEARGLAFVGSSNISSLAIGHGIEWNLRLDRDDDREGYERLVDAFEALWLRAEPLTAEWIRAYAERARAANTPLSGPSEGEPAFSPPTPHGIQTEALAALAESRRRGQGRALVVLATGLGKTWLGAFDIVRAFEGRPGPPRVLFLAHRVEILDQAAVTLGQMLRWRWPGASVGICAGTSEEYRTDLVLASIQKVGNDPWLSRLTAIRWDYVIVDEVHHATAAGYRKVLDRLGAEFVLGLTATPERTDEADVLRLFDDHLAYRADLDRGIGEGLLAPFAYFGLRDTTDFANIPWRNRRFDPELLSRAVETEARMERLWRAWSDHRGTRTLVFCCSISHAIFVKRWLHERGVRIEAVHSGRGSDDRELALARLKAGLLDAVVTVDLFNEGVDLPTIDRVVMLRPTESPVVFLQQLGRGLRRSPGKERVTVIDFVGNHRVFLDRIGRLVSLGARGVDAVRVFLDNGSATLPPGCSIEIELEAIELLKRLLPAGRSELERLYRDLRDQRSNREHRDPRESRPRLGEIYRFGVSLQPLRTMGGWFGFVGRLGDLTPEETKVLDACGAWLRELEIGAMSRCFKAVVIEVLLDHDALFVGMPLSILAEKSRASIMRSPELVADIEGASELGDTKGTDPAKWLKYWRKNPIAAWTGGPFFALEERGGEEILVLQVRAPEGLESVLVELTRELVDYRMAQYRRRLVTRAEPSKDVFEYRAVLAWSGRDPTLAWEGERPEPGTFEARVEGVPWDFVVTAEGVTEAARVMPGRRRNQLPDLLRRWFGPEARRGAPEGGVRFVRSPDVWWVEPSSQRGGAELVDLASRRVRAYPSLKAAAGVVEGPENAEEISAEARVVEGDPEWATEAEVFLVRVTGDSMDGGPRPIRDGDWVALRWARGLGLPALEGRVALVQVEDEVVGFAWQLKRVVRDGTGWLLRSDNPARPGHAASPKTVAVATLVDVVTADRVHDPDASGRAARPARPARPSRILPAEAKARAEIAAEQIVSKFETSDVPVDGGQVRVLGRIPKGGIRIDGGEGGFSERAVSLVDLGWVLVARDEAERLGVPLDEALVNRCRYHDGVRRSQTRWIDTRWAMILLEALRDR